MAFPFGLLGVNHTYGFPDLFEVVQIVATPVNKQEMLFNKRIEYAMYLYASIYARLIIRTVSRTKVLFEVV